MVADMFRNLLCIVLKPTLFKPTTPDGGTHTLCACYNAQPKVACTRVAEHAGWRATQCFSVASTNSLPAVAFDFWIGIEADRHSANTHMLFLVSSSSKPRHTTIGGTGLGFELRVARPSSFRFWAGQQPVRWHRRCAPSA
jgi:hypothetical protein